MAVAEQAQAWDVFEQFERDVCQLGHVGGLLGWDEQVNMPPRGAAARGAAKATLAGILHERICDERFGEAIAELDGRRESRRVRARPRARGAPRARPRRARPAALVRELAEAESAGFEAWQMARAAVRLLALPRPARAARAAAARGGRRRRLRGRRALRRAARPVRARHARGPARAAAARPARRARAVRARDRRAPAARRLVRAPHLSRAGAARRRRAPGGRDRLRLRGRAPRRGGASVRLRLRARGRAPDDARERERPLRGPLRGAARGRPRPLRAGPHRRDRGHVLRHATSLGLHESQSRFWENMVGRSRAFWERHLSELKAAFPEQLATSRSTRSCAPPTWSSPR